MDVFDQEEFDRWLSQANHTFASAERDAHQKDFAWACFKAQQAGEYALKALLRGLSQPAYGHALKRLLGELAELNLEVPEKIQSAGQALDRHYIPARYPDAYPEGSPHEYYDQKTAKEALDAAAEVIGWVEGARTKT